MDKRYQTFWPRFAAAIIDGLVLLPVSILLGFVYKSGLPVVVYAALILDYVVFFAYSISLHGYYGQTIGKWVMKVQVVNIDETRLTMRQAFLRDSIGISLALVYLLFAINPVFSGVSPDSRDFKAHIPSVILNVGLLVLILELVTMLTNAKRRSLHDFIAGSVVVRRSNSTFEKDAREDSARPST
jgi:uncharacterized RDD family membrane protein YckC